MNHATVHGLERIAKRAGVGKKAASRLAEIVIRNGIPRQEIKGPAKPYVDALHAPMSGTDILVHAGNVYVVNAEAHRIVTMYSMPGRIKSPRRSPRFREALDITRFGMPIGATGEGMA